jgi:hypothetical protein
MAVSKVLRAKTGRRRTLGPVPEPEIFHIRHGMNWDPPISREILGPPKSVKVVGQFGPETAILRPCKCDWCGRQFENHGPSVLCPTCMDAIDFAMEKLEGVSEGNLPALVSRTTKETKVREGTGVRPKVSKHDTGESIFRG